MKGIIFVVWEKYLGERFGKTFLDTYRDNIGESKTNLPMTSRTYADDAFYQGLSTVSKMSFVSPDRLLYEYGHYFMLNGLVEYLCGYLLAQSWNARDLLLQMREAHAQMRRTPDGVMPPLFSYDILSSDQNHMVLTYDSQRQLCSLLDGAIHGSAQRFGQKVHTREISCMKHGASVCRFEVRFKGKSWAEDATPQRIEQEKRRLSKQGITNLILQVLSNQEAESLNLNEIKTALDQHQGAYFPEIYERQPRLEPVHISQLYTGLAKLQQVGLVASTVNREGDTFNNRRYWLASTQDA